MVVVSSSTSLFGIREKDHHNLVKLFGKCIEGRRHCSMYELVCNGSDESHFHGFHWSSRLSPPYLSPYKHLVGSQFTKFSSFGFFRLIFSQISMSYYDHQQQPPVGAPPPQGYPPKDAYPPPGYPAQGYPPPEYGYPQQGYPPPHYAQQQPPNQQVGFLEGCLAALCCCCMLDACF